ncbi:succinate-semialdehyde dehydrogenase/glutarate-semialdehyde dehydrogenase [Wenyingzhuangia heitensis]|uniref:Succinate-semialdehyde dehydrogenase/glutarate-semialdehyde dehydrogenase n=1 Tax=Wenyingzhuangia heitensis TaxID=1487859 RepID=A0ABX0UFB6_9FLAO|nr:aldehyde dehydrogenase family protein [Wenyingzhuangia heitensis]NIJ46570.1 succinate-semialdehyde dehydrogenase/glutarate-semialdehyde dehydrogenase [Wenyingzhuangia heitensis]
MYVTINPYNQDKLKEYSYLSNTELEQKLDAVAKTYADWKNESIETKIKLGKTLSDLLFSEKVELATLISSEMGKPIKQTIAEVEKCADLVDYITQNVNNFLSPSFLDTTTYINYTSTGAVFGIMPWNFPLWQIFRYAFPTIMGGNVALLKHAPNTFGCGKAVEELFIKAGFPSNVFTNLIIDISQTEQVISTPIVQGVCVTGSAKAGSSVASLAGKYLKKSVLELGGTDACVLFKDADFETALTATFNSRMTNAGQVCIAPKRIFVPKNKITEVITFFKSKIDELILGNPLDPKTTMGPISKSQFLPVLEKQVKKAIELGATLIAGGKIKTPFFEPTLLLVNNDNTILKEEIFGPVLCIISYDDETNLLSEINNTDYGLGTAIWSANLEKAKEWATQIEVGFVTINKIVRSDVRYPFGGVKKSGYGKELGEAGFKTFLNEKVINF